MLSVARGEKHFCNETRQNLFHCQPGIQANFVEVHKPFKQKWLEIPVSQAEIFDGLRSRADYTSWQWIGFSLFEKRFKSTLLSPHSESGCWSISSGAIPWWCSVSPLWWLLFPSGTNLQGNKRKLQSEQPWRMQSTCCQWQHQACDNPWGHQETPKIYSELAGELFFSETPDRGDRRPECGLWSLCVGSQVS